MSNTVDIAAALLDRKPLSFTPEMSLRLSDYWQGKTILVTGGSGSIGSELVKTLARIPCRIVVYDRSETNLTRIMSEGKASSNPDKLVWGTRVVPFLGDVSQSALLDYAFRLYSPDAVIHAAAYKHLPLLETFPLQAIENNVIGTLNVLSSAIHHNTPKFILISTDKACLSGSSSIELSSGQTVRIRDLVIGRGTAKVRTLDLSGHFTDGSIVNWFKNPLAERRMIHLRLTEPCNYDGGKPLNGLWLTEDHLVMTPNGWCKASDLKSGDEVTTSSPSPNPKQLALIVGTLLGDAHASLNVAKSPNGYANGSITVGHAENQLEWLKLLHSSLKEFSRFESPRLEYDRKYLRRRRFWQVYLRSTPSFVSIYREFYKGSGSKRKKVVPRQLVMNNFCDELLAAWYMDDGTFVPNGKYKPSARLETQGFCEDDVRWLADLLIAFGMSAYAYRHVVSGKTYWQIRFRVDGAEELFRRIARFLPPCMRYKLPKDAPHYDVTSWNLGLAVPHICKIIVESDSWDRLEDVYCLDIADTHNFCANGFVVHNCNPTSVMGATKRLAELMALNPYHGAIISSHSRKSHRYPIVVRLGNVLGSSGSVLPLFEAQIAAGGPITVTHPNATRFFMSIPEAANLILTATVIGQGRQTFVLDMGKPVNIAYMARQLANIRGRADIEIKFTGMRPGEKLDEQLYIGDTLPTAHPLIWEVKSGNKDDLGWHQFNLEWRHLKHAIERLQPDHVMHCLRMLVPEYKQAHLTEANTHA